MAFNVDMSHSQAPIDRGTDLPGISGPKRQSHSLASVIMARKRYVIDSDDSDEDVRPPKQPKIASSLSSRKASLAQDAGQQLRTTPVTPRLKLKVRKPEAPMATPPAEEPSETIRPPLEQRTPKIKSPLPADSTPSARAKPAKRQKNPFAPLVYDMDYRDITDQADPATEEEFKAKDGTVKKLFKLRDADHRPLQWPQPDHWQGGELLGKGAFGKAYLYCRTDEYENVIDRVAVKDCILTPWLISQGHSWVGDPTDWQLRQHVEIAVMECYRGREGAEHCVQLRGYETQPDGLFYRLYMGYAPHGSLLDIIDTYSPAELDDDKKRKKAKAGKPRQWVPAAFVWSVLSSLTRACLALERKGSDGSLGEVMVHRDLKPENVFLDLLRATDDEPWSSYPHPLLGDFGVTLVTSGEDALNPWAYQGNGGTAGWMAPEMNLMYERKTGRQASLGRLSSSTNVWGIGAVIIALMNTMVNLDGTTFLKKTPERPLILEACIGRFGEELCSLAKSCTAYKPEHRVTLPELREAVQAYLSQETESAGLPPEELQGYKADSKYKVGMAMAS